MQDASSIVLSLHCCSDNKEEEFLTLFSDYLAVGARFARCFGCAYVVADAGQVETDMRIRYETEHAQVTCDKSYYFTDLTLSVSAQDAIRGVMQHTLIFVNIC
eukprot:1737504-Amphidinium_carterae.1